MPPPTMPLERAAPTGRHAGLGHSSPTDERLARRSLMSQIARLEHQLGHHDAGTVEASPADRPRLLGLRDLELSRDRLIARVARAHGRELARAGDRRRAQLQLERMLADPGRHRWMRVSNADLGRPGCAVYQVRPRMGPIGMLSGWWQVKLSSGCPLATGSGASPLPAVD